MTQGEKPEEKIPGSPDMALGGGEMEGGGERFHKQGSLYYEFMLLVSENPARVNAGLYGKRNSNEARGKKKYG